MSRERIEAQDCDLCRQNLCLSLSDVRDRVEQIRYECEDPDTLDMLHKLQDELDMIAESSSV